MHKSNINPNWPKPIKVAVLDDSGQPRIAYAYYGMHGNYTKSSCILSDEKDVPVIKVLDLCPICREPSYRYSEEFMYGSYKLRVVIYGCGSIVAYGGINDVLMYIMSDECAYRIEDII